MFNRYYESKIETFNGQADVSLIHWLTLNHMAHFTHFLIQHFLTLIYKYVLKITNCVLSRVNVSSFCSFIENVKFIKLMYLVYTLV